MPDNGRVLVVLNRERLAVEVGRTNLHTFDTPPHIPGDGHRASGLHRRAILLNQIADFCQHIGGHLGLLGWLGSSVGFEQFFQIRQTLRGG